MTSFSRCLIILAWLNSHSDAFCPQGFGGDGFFPEEWQIPKWPSMDLEDAQRLVTVTLSGFKMASINEEYLEGPTDEFKMQGRETYWQASGKYFMFYCERFAKWRIAEISAFSKNMGGNCFAFVSDGTPGRDILNASLIKGWIEVENGQWAVRPDAGVAQVGKLIDQMAAQEEDEEDVQDSNCTTDVGDDPFKPKDDSNCPVMPHVRRAKDKVVRAAKVASKWVKRLFPKMLGAPDEEDLIPEEDGGNPLFPEEEVEEGACQPSTQDGCNFKEKFYIEKQQKADPEKRKSELVRLSKMIDVVMKPDQAQWVRARVRILRHLVSIDRKDELDQDPEL